MTQRDKILKLFEGGGWVRVQEMNPIAYRYGAILFDLRRDGYKFQKRKQWNSTLEEWRLIGRGQPAMGVKVPAVPQAPVLEEVVPVTPEQAESIRLRLSAIKERHGQI
jgi:hypothetical protein